MEKYRADKEGVSDMMSLLSLVLARDMESARRRLQCIPGVASAGRSSFQSPTSGGLHFDVKEP